MEQPADITAQWDDFLEKRPNEYFSDPQEKWITEEEREAFLLFDQQLKAGEDLHFEWKPRQCETLKHSIPDASFMQPENITRPWDNHLAEQPSKYFHLPNEGWISSEEKKSFAAFSRQLQEDSDEPLECVWQH